MRLTRFSNYSNGSKQWSLEISDAVNNNGIIEVEMSAEDFTEMFGGGCIAEATLIHPGPNFNLKMTTETYYFDVRKADPPSSSDSLPKWLRLEVETLKAIHEEVMTPRRNNKGEWVVVTHDYIPEATDAGS